MTHDDSISVAQEAPLKALGINTPDEALFVLPSSYIDLRAAQMRLNGSPLDGKTRLFSATLSGKAGFDGDNEPTNSLSPRRLNLELRFADGIATACVFGGTFEWAKIKLGTVLTLTGILENGQYGFQVKSFSIQGVTGRAMPVYTGVGGKIAGAVIDRAVQEAAIDAAAMRVAGRRLAASGFARRVLLGYGYPSADTFLFDLHRPLTPEHGEKALSAARQVCIEEVRSLSVPVVDTSLPPLPVDQAMIARVKAQPETLSLGQRRALNSIRIAFSRRPGARVLLNGDVGSGKTLVFLLAAASVCDTQCDGGNQRVAIMVPSDLVARQIFNQCLSRFPELHPALVIAGAGDIPAESRLLVGTQALLNANIGKLGLLVVDEQHKFSVAQRSKLADATTHIIEASATPIPRSLTLALFDGWTESRIDGGPVERQIVTHLVESKDRSPVVASVRTALQNGNKVVFLYPAVSSGFASCKAAAERLAAHFEGKLGMVHGKLLQRDKDAAMEAFRTGEKPILVASSAIEVGVDVPGITVMVINDADRFGAAQLHQIRGRCVRNGGRADCYLVVDRPLTKSKKIVLEGEEKPKAALAADTKARLESVRDNLDGFALAEREMEMRGFGELLGEAQSGATNTIFKLPRLQPADFVRR